MLHYVCVEKDCQKQNLVGDVIRLILKIHFYTLVLGESSGLYTVTMIAQQNPKFSQNIIHLNYIPFMSNLRTGQQK